MPPNLDIRTAVQVAIALMVLGAVVNLWFGIRALRGARGVPFFRLRHERMVKGWRMLIYAVALVLLTFVTSNYAEPVAYRFFPPSPTATLRPTITLTPSVTITPSITLTPTITETPSETNTPTITPTPMIPVAIEARFEGEVTSIPNAVFSPLEFSQGIDALYRPLNPGFEFANPVGHLYAVFSYDGMVNGVQWTALWYRNGELVHFETKPWDGSTGGFGYSDWEPDSIEWLPGLYQVQMFVGLEWKVVGDFSVTGEPPTQTASLSPTITETPLPTITPTPTIGPPPSSTPTLTPTPTRTPTVTRTSPPTFTSIPATPTFTRQPPATPITPSPTLTRQPTLTSPPP